MSDFSKSPLETLIANQKKGYVGIHVEQGVPILDRDLNLLNDLITATVRSVITRYIGNGIAAGTDEDTFDFEIQAIPADNDFRIKAGKNGEGACLVGGLEVTIPDDITYSSQPGIQALKTPDATQPDPREDTVFLDAWLIDVDGTKDSDLLNSIDVGMQTSIRQKPTWVVRVEEGVPVPASLPGHVHYPLAKLIRRRSEPKIQASMITDLRQTRLTLAAAERRIHTLEKLLKPVFSSKQEFDPELGKPGDEVNIFGQHFSLGDVAVFFDSTPASLVETPTAPTDTMIVVKVPDLPAGKVKITVTTAIGSAVSSEDFIVESGGGGGQAPEFASQAFDPELGAVNDPVTIKGDHFDVPGLVVTFDSQTSPFVSKNATIDSFTRTVINTHVPAGLLPGEVKITVKTDNGSITSTDPFIVTS